PCFLVLHIDSGGFDLAIFKIVGLRAIQFSVGIGFRALELAADKIIFPGAGLLTMAVLSFAVQDTRMIIAPECSIHISPQISFLINQFTIGIIDAQRAIQLPAE